jgi:hypothetical protein
MKKVLGVLVVLILAAVGFVAAQPPTYHVERSTIIAATADVVFPKINDLHQFVDWSPWEKIDPSMQKSWEGAASGVGAAYHWSGNDKVGEGRMTITESEPNEKVGMKLDFIKPWKSTANVTFTLIPAAEGTRVLWAMDGNKNFISKAMCVFVSMDKMVGGDFDKGLASLKQISEAQRPAPADSAQIGELGAGSPSKLPTH